MFPRSKIRNTGHQASGRDARRYGWESASRLKMRPIAASGFVEEKRCQAQQSVGVLTLKMGREQFDAFKEDVKSAVDGIDSFRKTVRFRSLKNRTHPECRNGRAYRRSAAE